MNVQRAIDSLTREGFAVRYFETANEAADYLAGAIRGKTVGIGGSVTIEQMGLYERLCEHNTVYWHDEKPEGMSVMETRRAASRAAVYVSSVNGIAETGEIVNIDGSGNRVAALCYGPDSVIVVAGMNKVAADLDSAISRARHIAAPANAQRFNGKTPCSVNGQCADCASPDCICSQIVVTRFCKVPGRIKVVLVGEDLGL